MLQGGSRSRVGAVTLGNVRNTNNEEGRGRERWRGCLGWPRGLNQPAEVSRVRCWAWSLVPAR